MALPRDPDPVWLDTEPPATDVMLGGFSFQLRGDTLADIRFDGATLLRSLRFIVRDADWGTVPAALERMLPLRNGGFGFTVRTSAPGVELVWTASIAADQGSLRFAVTATAETAFRRNRIGLIVLHPPTVAGEQLEVLHPGGESSTTAFPVQIAPHQPAHDVAGYRWSTGGVAAELSFEGDVFEMEDQRNWTDASFKTYSTPLSLPFPVDVAVGDTIEQVVTLTARRAAVETPDDPEPAQPEAAATVPLLAFGATTAAEAAVPRPEWLRGSAVLVELDAASPNWRAALERAVLEADGDPLDVRLVADDAAQTDAMLGALVDLRVERLGVFHPRSHLSEPEQWSALVAGSLARGLAATLVGGVRSHFTELNRNHERLPGGAEGVAFSVTAQMHDLERAQVVESLAMQRIVAEQAVRIAAGTPVHVGPVTLRSRFNAVATSPRPLPAGDDLAEGYAAQLVPGATDPRQLGHGYAAWLIGSVAALSAPGVASIAYAEASGPRGLADASGRRYPASYAAEWLVPLAGAPLVAVGLTRPGTPATVAARTADGDVLLLGNPWDVPATAVVPPGTLERYRVGDAAPVPETLAEQTTVRLAPGEVARLRS
jgi:hypothetical protein